MPARTFIIGTRGSRLALRQAEIVLHTLRSIHPEAAFETRTIRTEGDQSAASLSEIGGRGVFVIELERALLAGGIDIAVHSLKDLPSDETAGLAIAAVLEREDPRDVLVSRDGRTLTELPAGSVIGTGSPRRAAQVAALRPDLRVKDIRGNVETRIRKTDEGEYEAVILAAAGLARLGLTGRVSQFFPADEMLPAVAQGTIAAQVRAEDMDAMSLVSVADHALTRFAVTAERAFERRLGGGCHAAIAAYGEVSVPSAAADGEEPRGSIHAPLILRGPQDERGPSIHVRGLVGGSDGKLIRSEVSGPAHDAEALGVRLAEQLIEQGAAELLEAAP